MNCVCVPDHQQAARVKRTEAPLAQVTLALKEKEKK